MNHRFIVGLLALLLFSSAHAENLSYRYLDIFKQDADLDLGGGTTANGDLVGITLSFPINNTIFVQGAYAEGDVESVIDITGLEVSIGAHFPLNATTDLVAHLTHSETEIRYNGDSETTDGESLEVGFRSQFDSKLELFASYWADLDDSDTSVEIGGLVKLTPSVALGLSYENGNDYDVTTIDLRVYLD